MIDLVGKRFLFLAISLIVIIPGVVAVLLGGLKPGIDFTGGTRLTVIPINDAAANTESFTNALATVGYGDSHVQAGTVSSTILTKTVTMDIPRIAGMPDAQREQERSKIAHALIDAKLVPGSLVTETISLAPTPVAAESTVTTTGTVGTSGTVTTTNTVTTTGTVGIVGSTGTITATGTTTGTTGTTGATATPTTAPLQQTLSVWRIADSSVLAYNTVGPTIGSELIGRAFIAIALASVAILIYLTIVFRRVPNAFRYGVCAIIALIHDVLVVLGVFAILGFLLNEEIDSLFITAMLTVIGFSVHDTIVVFDRTRENLMKRRFEKFEDVVNYSVVQTLARSINTSITVMLTLFALFLFGGDSIRSFVLALLIGIFSGTYSSIFNASMLLVIWENKEWLRPFRRGSGQSQAPARTVAR
jgi:preprotein translocase subunit SecF